MFDIQYFIDKLGSNLIYDIECSKISLIHDFKIVTFLKVHLDTPADPCHFLASN